MNSGNSEQALMSYVTDNEEAFVIRLSQRNSDGMFEVTLILIIY